MRKPGRKPFKIKPQGAVTQEKAQLLGFLAGDGCIADSGGRAINTDPGLLQWIREAVRDVYGVEVSAYTTSKGRISPLTSLFLCKAIAHDLHSLTTWGIFEWSVPACVKNACDSVKGAYLRGFFDAEGTVFFSLGIGTKGKHHHTVAASSANRDALLQVAGLLGELGITHGFYDTKAEVQGEIRTYYKVQIHRRASLHRFADTVGFLSSGKAKKLKTIRDLPLPRPKGSVYEERLKEIQKRGLGSATAREVSEVLGCSQKQVWDTRKWARGN